MATEAKDAGKPAITPDQMKTILKDITSKQAKASEASGLVGGATSTAVERFGLEKNALTTVRRMHGMEETKRQAFLVGVIDYAHKAGFFDQIDAFDPMSDILNEILEHIGGNKQPAVDATDNNIHKLQ